MSRFRSALVLGLLVAVLTPAAAAVADDPSGTPAAPDLRLRAESVPDYGHRGARAPGVDEDTVPACLSALQGGADGCEVDVRRSRDGVLLLMHDPTLRRTSRRCHGAVSRMAFWRVQRCHLRHGGVVPSYDQLVAAVAGYAQSTSTQPRLLVEYKAPDLRRRDVAHVLAISARHGFGPGALTVESGSPRMLRWSAGLAPSVPRYLINFERRRILRAASLGWWANGVIVMARNLQRALRVEPTYVDAFHASGRHVMIWGHSWGQGVGAVSRGVDAVILDQSDRFDAWRDGR